MLFWNTLFDENAASHIALGQAYSTCLIGGEKMDDGGAGDAGRERQPDPCGLDDRLRRDGCGRHCGGWNQRATDAQGRVGLDICPLSRHARIDRRNAVNLHQLWN